MTATEAHAESHESELDVTVDDATGDGLYLLVASNDHKMVGRLWIGASLLFLLVVSVLGVLNGFERASLSGIDLFGSVASYFQSWVLFRTGGVFLVAIPLFLGIATAVVPLQVGAGGIAFPRLSAAAFWAWFIGGCVHLASFLADGGLGPADGTSSEATLLTVTSLVLMIGAILAASICVATTVIALRPSGMSLLNVPAFAWSMLVACSVWLLSLPVLVANLIYVYADLQGRDPIFFGERSRIWGDVSWAWEQPQVYAYAIPVLGVLAEIGPVAAKTRQVSRSVIFSMIGLFGALSFGAWAQHSFSRGADPVFTDGNRIYDEFLYIAFGLVVVLPILGVIGGVLDTIRRGATPKISAALLGGLMGAILLLLAAVAGEIRVIPLWDGLHEDNVLLSTTTAQLSLVLAAVVVSGAGALAWWAPKIFGGYAREPLAMLAIVTGLGAGAIGGVADLISGLMGQPDISVSDAVESGVETFNVIAAIGAVLLVLAALALIGSVMAAVTSKETLPDDPWEGHTLEWAAPSPPPVGNFVEPLPVITSEAPLLDEFEEVN